MGRVYIKRRMERVYKEKGGGYIKRREEREYKEKDVEVI